MTLDIEHNLQVAAPREAVLRFLLDPEKVVTCLPGAELLEVVDPRHFVGRVKVKVGPITVAYKGKARLTEVDVTVARCDWVCSTAAATSGSVDVGRLRGDSCSSVSATR